MSLCRSLTRTRPRELEKWGSDTDRVRPRARFGSGQEVAADPTKARLLFSCLNSETCVGREIRATVQPVD